MSRMQILRKDLAWGPHADVGALYYSYFSSYSVGRALLTDTGTIDYGPFRRGNATKIWMITVGNGASNGGIKGVRLCDLDTDIVLKQVTADVCLGVDTIYPVNWYAMDLTDGGPDQDVYLQFYDNDTTGWFGVVLQSLLFEV